MIIFILIVVVIFYLLNKMNSKDIINIMGGAYFDKTYKVESNIDTNRRPEKFRYTKDDDIKVKTEKAVEYEKFIKEINERPMDINFKLRYIFFICRYKERVSGRGDADPHLVF